MPIELYAQDKAKRLNDTLVIWLSRTAGLMLFGLGVAYWIRLVGIYDGLLMRFDLMPTPWKAAAAALAVLYPVAGIGLWMTASWGAAVWAIVAAVEFLMHVAFAGTFGGITVWLFAHAFGLSLLVAFRLVGWWEARRRPRAAGAYTPD